MSNLLIAIIGIVFCAALLAGGMTFIKPVAFIEHNEANSNTSQITTLMADYKTLNIVLGHRPGYVDYQAVYPKGSSNAAYSVSSTAVTIPSLMNSAAYQSTGANKQVSTARDTWAYMPKCGDGSQDCFCLTVNSPTDVVYRSSLDSAKQELNSSSQSRIEFSTGQCDDSAAQVNPASWPATTPTQGFFLTVRLNGALPATSNPGGYWVGVPGSCSASCGSGTVTTSYVCQGGTCSTPQPLSTTSTCQGTAGCEWSPSYGVCQCDYSQTVSYNCTMPDGKTPVSRSDCLSIEPNTASQQCTPAANSGCIPGTWQPTTTTCTATCGAGTTTTTYSCPTNTCPPPQPNQTTASCQGTTTCEWVPGYGACTCSGTQSISYSCTMPDGKTPVQSSDCSKAEPTQTSQSCAPPQSCYTGTWVPSTTACSATCGTGSTTTTYSCHGGLCSTPQPQTTTASCEGNTSCEWVPTYGTCSCQGQESVSYACTMSNGVTPVSTNDCPPPEPSTAPISCAIPASCYTGTWVPSTSACSSTCGPGQTTTTYSCQGGPCSTPQPPNEYPSCEGTSSCQWQPTYGTCSCSGTESVSYTCNAPSGQQVQNGDCTSPEPSTAPIGCTIPASCYTGTWVPSTSGCSSTCGPGQTTTTYSCQGGPCSTPQPQTTYAGCSGTSSCEWSPIYGSCSCSGIESVSYTCTTSNGVTQVGSNYCTSPQPPSGSTLCLPPSSCAQNGQCGGGLNQCGLKQTAYGQTSDANYNYWTCPGVDGGNPQPCKMLISIPGQCNNASKFACAAGNLDPNGQTDNGSTASWYCDGKNGGGTSPQCVDNYNTTPVCDNVCSSHNYGGCLCTGWQMENYHKDGPNLSQWDCVYSPTVKTHCDSVN